MTPQLELKHLAPYLPYGLKCEYEGIINGSEISKQRREFQKENEPFTNWEYYEPIKEIKGFKIAPLKTIHIYKKYWVATCGIYNGGRKSFYNGKGIKPILRPLSDLTKEIDVNGEKFVPIKKFQLVKDEEGIWCDEFSADYAESPTAKVPITEMNLWLFEYRFDVFNLISQGLAIDINTLK